jgi:hypothetical protein
MGNRRNWPHNVKAIVNPHRIVFVLSTLTAFTVIHGQDVKIGKSEPSLVPKGLPSAVQHQVQVLGTRMQGAGKEETVLDAQFLDDVGNKKSIHVVHHTSGMVRIEGMHDKTAVAFDGEFTHGVADRTDEALMDTFVSDTPEGMFYSLRNGASIVLLGHDLHPDSRATSDVKGPRYDVYVVTAPDRIRGPHTLQARRFYFDSATGLLSSTRYSDSAGVGIETRFLNWEHIDGSAYPTTLERYENGRLTFSIISSSAAGQPQRNAKTIQ